MVQFNKMTLVSADTEILTGDRNKSLNSWLKCSPCTFNQSWLCCGLFQSIRSDSVMECMHGRWFMPLLLWKHFFPSLWKRLMCIFPLSGLMKAKTSGILWAPTEVVGAIPRNISVICVALIALLFHEPQFPSKYKSIRPTISYGKWREITSLGFCTVVIDTDFGAAFHLVTSSQELRL